MIYTGQSMSADEADVARVENGTYDMPLSVWHPDIPLTAYAVVAATVYPGDILGTIVTPYRLIFATYDEAEAFIMSVEELPTSTFGEVVRTYTILEYLLPPL